MAPSSVAFLAVSLLVVVATLPGCIRVYSVTALQESGTYVVVQANGKGNMKVYDCASASDGAYNPTCTRVDFNEQSKK